MGAQVSGRVLEVLVDVGDRVKKGQVLVRLDPSFFQIECEQNKAILDGAIVARQDAEINYNRMKNLWEKPGNEPPSISKKLYDDAKLLYNRASSKVKESEAALKYSKQRYDESVIRSPYDAVVTRRMVDPGEPVTSAPTTYLLELQEVDTLELDFSLPQKMLSYISKGNEFEFTVEGINKGTGSGKIAVVFPTIDENTRSFKCRAYIDNANGRYCAGLLANVRVVDRVAKDVLTLPRAALTQTATGWQVNVQEKGRPVIRDVGVGIMMDQLVEIRSGLKLGEKVLVAEEGN
jgi:membrane fusion protein (multidrug efflux system)